VRGTGKEQDGREEKKPTNEEEGGWGLRMRIRGAGSRLRNKIYTQTKPNQEKD